jgi:hypothetical protein
MLRGPKHPRPPTLQRRRLPNREVVRVVCVVPDLDFEARVTFDRAEVVEGSDGWIETQFIGVHLASSTADNAYECLKIVLIREVIVLRDHSTGSIEQANVKDGTTHCNMEGVAHEGAGSEMKAGNICDLANYGLDFRRSFQPLEYSFMVLASRRRSLSREVLLVMSYYKKEGTYDFLRVWFLVRVNLHLHINAGVTSVWVTQGILTNREVNEGDVRTTVVNHIERGGRRTRSSLRPGDFGAKCVPSPHGRLPLYPRTHIEQFVVVLTVVVVVVVAVVAVIAVAVLGIGIGTNFSREVYLRIGSNTLTVGIHPVSVYMACVVVVY